MIMLHRSIGRMRLAQEQSRHRALLFAVGAEVPPIALLRRSLSSWSDTPYRPGSTLPCATRCFAVSST
jgi:hypothetical protein